MRRVSAPALVAYVALGTALLATRFVGLGRSFWHDEIVTVRDFVQAGPHAILAGDRLNHELYSLLAWGARPVLGDSEIAVRLWSVVPFILGVVVVTAWLHLQLGQLTGVMFLGLATIAPLLIDVSRQARGYGIGFLAMSIVVVGALEADRTKRTWTVVVFCLAGVVGTLTLPNFAAAFLATGAVLVAQRELRRRIVIGLGVSVVAVVGFYAPNLDVLSNSSEQNYGVRIDALRVVTGPFDQLLLPGLLRLDGEPPTTSLLWLPFVALIAVLVAASPLLRNWTTALIMCAGVVFTFATLWVTETRSVPRFITFLLVPMLMLLASGLASILGRPRHVPIRAGLALATTLVLILVSVAEGATVMRLPREAHRDAAELIESSGTESAPVFAYMLQPRDLGFYTARPIRTLRRPSAIASLCAKDELAVLVVHPWRIPRVHLPCHSRAGVRRDQLEQYARGGHIDVWFIPPAS